MKASIKQKLICYANEIAAETGQQVDVEALYQSWVGSVERDGAE